MDPSSSDVAKKSALPSVPRLKRCQTTTAILQEPRESVVRLGAIGRHGSLPRRQELPGRLAGQPSTLRSATDQRHKSVSEEEEAVGSGHDDGTSHYFAIETRLELQDRLRAVQRQLDGMLMRAKLAWMKCFSAPTSSLAPSKRQHSPSRAAPGVDGHDVMAWAAELVERVEALASSLALAFSSATSGDGNGSLDEYKALVERVEQQLAALLTFVDQIASAPPDCFRRMETTESVDMEGGHDATKPSGSTCRETVDGIVYPSAPVAFDLPSMKQYCARVAPPYAAYTTSKPGKRRGR